MRRFSKDFDICCYGGALTRICCQLPSTEITAPQASVESWKGNGNALTAGKMCHWKKKEACWNLEAE